MTLLMLDTQFVACCMQKNFCRENHDMAVVMAMAEGAVYKGKPILVKDHEEVIINAKKKKKLFAKAGYLKDEIK